MATALAAAVLAAPAAAQSRRVHFAFSGSLTLSWHGDPARGCAAAGLCGYAGSLTLGAPASGDVTISNGMVTGFDSGGADDSALAVRVARERPGGAGGTCVDALPGEPAGFDPTRIAGTRYAIRLTTDLSAGRCAGPLPGELEEALGAPAFDLAALGPSGATVRWPGGPLAAGPFSGDVRSSLTARVTHARPARRPARGRLPALAQQLRAHRVWVTNGSWTYRVHSLSGTAGARVEGAGDCVLLDSCGVAGTLDYRLAATSGGLLITANRLSATPPRRTRTGAVELSALSLDGFGEVGTRTTGTLTASLARPGESPCADADPAPAPELTVRRAGARRLAIALGGDSGGDVLRSRCPGPSQADVFGAGSIARATLPLSDLGRPRLRVTLARAGAFSAPGYGGTRHAALTLDLRLVRVRPVRTINRRLP